MLRYERAIHADQRQALAVAIEDFVDREAVVVPLYAAKRIAVRRRELRGVEFGEHGYRLDLARMRIVE